MELCLALTAAASSSRVEVAAFLLSHVPHHVLQTLSAEILKVFLELTPKRPRIYGFKMTNLIDFTDGAKRFIT